MKIIEKFAEHCGLVDTEKRWLVREVDEMARGWEMPEAGIAAIPIPVATSRELDAFDAVLRELFQVDAPAGDLAPTEALGLKVARGCLSGVEKDGLFLTDEIIVEAIEMLNARGAIQPEDVPLLATFLGQFAGSPNARDLGTVCQEVLRREDLLLAQRLDLALAVVGCYELPAELRAAVLKDAVEHPAFPSVLGIELLRRVLLGGNLYRPLPLDDDGEYLDVRPHWPATTSVARIGELIRLLGDLASQFENETRERCRAEMADLDAVLDWLDTEQGAGLFEELAFQLAEKLPDVVSTPVEPDAESGESPLLRVHPGLRHLESTVQRSSDELSAPRRTPDVIHIGLTQVVEELLAHGHDPEQFAANVSAGGGSDDESCLMEVVGHVLDCTLPEAISQAYLPVGQLADLSDEELSRLAELTLAVRDGLILGCRDRVPADLVEMLAPYEPRTAARLNRIADDDLSFAAARLLVGAGVDRQEVAELAASVWTPNSLKMAAEEHRWASELIAEHPALFDPDLVAAARGGFESSGGAPGQYN